MNFTLTIESFKCFEKTAVPFNQLTILAGANSVGKSSVVQSLLLSRMVIERFRNTESWRSTLEEKKIMFPPESFSLNGPFLLNLGRSLEVLNRNAPEKRINFKLSVSGNDLDIALYLPEQEEDSYNLLLKDIQINNRKELPSLTLNNLFFYYLNAERIGPRIRHDVEDLLFPHTGWQGEYAIQVIGGNKSLHIEENRCFDVTQIQSLLHQSRLWLNNIAPGTILEDANLISGIKSADVNLGGSKPTNVGFGLSYVLPIIVNGLVATENSMFIVENPEAHLHPSGQSRIGQFLAQVASAGVQVVVETHSEHVINGIRIAALNGTLLNEDVVINFFNRDEDGQVKINPIKINDSGDLSSYPKGFFDQEQRDMAEIVRQKRKRMETKP